MGHFYQHYWNVIGDEITDAIHSFFQGGRMLKSLNYTIITVIPKVKQVHTMKDLRPIGLCNVLYKIKGKLISDNIVVSHEVMHHLKD